MCVHAQEPVTLHSKYCDLVPALGFQHNHTCWNDTNELGRQKCIKYLHIERHRVQCWIKCAGDGKCALTVGTPVRSFAHMSSQADLQVEVVEVGAGAQVHVSPRAAPVRALQGWRRVRGAFSVNASMKRAEPKRNKCAQVQAANSVVHHDPDSNSNLIISPRSRSAVFCCVQT